LCEFGQATALSAAEGEASTMKNSFKPLIFFLTMFFISEEHSQGCGITQHDTPTQVINGFPTFFVPGVIPNRIKNLSSG